MKKQNKKLITLLLAGAFCCTAALGVAGLQSVKAFADGTAQDPIEETTKSYALSELFTADALVKDQAQTTLQLGNQDKADYRHSMALKWFDGTKDAQGKQAAKYFTLKFAFADANFKTVTISVDTVSSVATEAGKATNQVKFTKLSADGNKLTVKVSVLADGDTEKEICASAQVNVGDVLTLSLTESSVCQYSDQFEVLLSNASAASLISEENRAKAVFKNVGANYAAYSTTENKEKYPLQFSAETEVTAETASKPEEEQEYQQTKLSIYELNGQSFGDASSNSVKDTAAPVLVVNEDVKGFLLGAPLSWSNSVTNDTVPQYVVIDVVKKTISDTKIEYYQYNPNVELEDGKIAYSTFKFDYELMPTVYELPNGKNTTVFDTEINGEKGREFISIRFLLNDEVNKDVEYQLAWYADEDALETIDANDYIIINQAKEGAKLAKGNGEFDAYVKAENGVNKYLTVLTVDEEEVPSYTTEYEGSELAKFVKEYNKLLATKAADIYAGSGATMQFPTLEGLFYDDNGYRNLNFTICYKTETSGPSSESVSYKDLELDAKDVGMYEVKIFATDKGENKMRLYDNDGNLVDVTSSNVWNIDAIPTFTYTVSSQGLKIKNETSDTAKATTKAIGETYTFSSLTVVGGAENQQTEYALFKIDMEEWGKLSARSSSFTSVKYEEIRKYIQDNKLLALVGDEADDKYATYFDLYLTVYATLLAEDVGLKDKVNEVLDCFERINAYNDRITEDDPEWEKYNKYKFQNNSFKILDDGGAYIMFAEYYDDENENFARVAGYKVVKAEEKKDINVGDTEWLKNNLVSIILFSIAAVMLVIIIILLFIKPSDETLEDVDEKAKAKKEEKETKK